MAGPAGPVVGDVLRAVGVVEDQQPAVPATQLGQQPLHGGGDRRSGRQVQPGGEPGELVGDEHRLFGVDPPHQVVVGGEPVRVLDRQLGLAHPAQPVQRLHHQRRLTGAQPPPQLGEHAVAAGEPRIPRRHPPHRRRAAGESRPTAGRRIRPRKRRRAGRAQPGQPAAQPGRGRGLVQPGQVQVDQWRVQRGQGDRLDEHRHDPPLGGAAARRTRRAARRRRTRRRSRPRCTPPAAGPRTPAPRPCGPRSPVPEPSPTHPARRCTRPPAAARPATPPTRCRDRRG